MTKYYIRKSKYKNILFKLVYDDNLNKSVYWRIDNKWYAYGICLSSFFHKRVTEEEAFIFILENE